MSDQLGSADHGDQLVIGGPDDTSPQRRRWWIGGGALALLAVGGGAATWAAMSFLGTGDQPAQALPDNTIGYVSVDLDPSGGQKIAALKLARKFPAFKEKVGLDTGDDVRKWLFEQVSDAGDCTVDYAEDVEPWLGSRAAVAAVGAADPFPVAVLQTTDAGKADAGLRKLAACDGGEGTAWKTVGDWTVVAETQAQVDQVVADTQKGSLADDAGFQEWTGKAGDSGILTAYAAPAAGAYLAQQISEEEDGLGAASTPGCPGASGKASAERMKAGLADFTGAAATLRFGSDGLELGMVGDAKALTSVGALSGKPSGTPVVTTLPADTAAAFGVALPKGWSAGLADGVEKLCGGSAGLDGLLGPVSEATGLSLPGDLEKLLGDSFALALGSDVDVEALVNGGDPSALPLALKTRGDKAQVDALLTRLRDRLGPVAGSVRPVAGDDSVAVALDESYAKAVAGAGGLGSSTTFTRVVPHAADANGVLYVDVDRLDPAIASLANDDPDVVGNTEPLRALGLSSWVDGDDAHGLLKITLD